MNRWFIFWFGLFMMDLTAYARIGADRYAGSAFLMLIFAVVSFRK